MINVGCHARGSIVVVEFDREDGLSPSPELAASARPGEPG